MKYLLYILFLLFTQAAYAQQEAPLKWAADSEGGAPYIFKDPNNPNQNIGFEVDIINELQKELKSKIQFTQYGYAQLANGLERGDFDFAMNGIEVTPDRQQRLRLSKPYYKYRLQLVTRKDEIRFNSYEDLKNLPNLIVGTLDDTAAWRLLRENGIKDKTYDGQAEPYQDLALGRIDAVLLDEPIAVYYALHNNKLQFMGSPFGEGFYAIAFRKDQEELAKKFDQAIEQLKISGKLNEIASKWETPKTDVLNESAKKFTFSIYFPILCKSALVTIYVSILSMALAMTIGLPVALCRLYGNKILRTLAIVYVEIFRGIPVLLLLYLLYYGLPSILANYGIAFKPSDLTVAILAFGMNYAGYEAEIYRAGISSIPFGQWEAGISLGMSKPQIFRRIILPQAFRFILPPVTNDFVALFKDTSLVSVIAVVELTKQYQILSKSSLKYMEIGLATAFLYLIMSIPLGCLARHLEQKWGKA